MFGIMSDENHIASAASDEVTRGIVAAALSAVIAAVITWRKNLWAWLTRHRRKTDGMMETLLLAFNRLTESFDKNTDELRGIRSELGDIGKTQRHINIEMRVFSAMAMIAFRESSTARWVTDKHGMCVDVNERAIELFQLPRDKMMGRGWTQRIRTSQIPDVSAAFDKAYASAGHIHYKDSYILDYDDGTSLTVVAEQSAIVRDDEGIYQMSGTIIPLPSHNGLRAA